MQLIDHLLWSHRYALKKLDTGQKIPTVLLDNTTRFDQSY